MSLNKSATRRFSLLAGSSLIAATLSAATVTLAPTAAFAANECAPIGVAPSANGATADVYACTGATTYQTSGITYSSEGNLTVNSTGAMDVGPVGVNLTGNTTGGVGDNVVFTATGVLTGTSGAVLDVTSTSGNITATTNGVAASAAGVTNAVKLQSTGGGNITYTKTGNTPPTSINNNVAGGQAAISAITNGGNITITAATGNPPTSAVQGRLYGLFAETGGAGSVAITSTGTGGIRASTIDGVAGISATAGTGGLTITVGGAQGGTGSAILANSGGNIGITSSGVLFGETDGIVADAAGAVTLSVSTVEGGNDGIVADAGGALSISLTGTSGFVTGASGDAIRGTAGAGATINNVGRIGRLRTSFSPVGAGSVDLSGVTGGGVTFSNTGSGVWLASGDNVFSAQNDLLVMAGTGVNEIANRTTIDFSGGVDTFNMSGILRADHLVITSLEAFNNSGTIFIGEDTAEIIDDDLLSAPGAVFTGTGSSRLRLNVVFGGAEQIGCETLTGAGGCLDLRDGTTAGSTIVTITDVTPLATLSGYLPNGITIVDVSGSGSSAAGHFTLDPASTGGYVHPVYGAAFERPGQAFVYLFRYDAENQRHVLISQPKNRDLFEYAILPGAAQSVWHLTAGTVANRQTDLRDGAGGGSVWLRTAGEVTRRDTATTFAGFDTTQTFDNGYNLYAGTIMGGMDLISGSSGGFDYVLGAQAGYVSSSFDMDESDTSGRFTGGTGGVYASLWSDSVFLDGAVNLNGLALDFQHPALGSKTTTYVNSVGARAEAGIRAQLTERSFAEPLATVSWVRTSFEEISLREGEVQPADSESLRAALGARLGATLAGESVSATWFVTGRAWYEFEGESAGLVHNPGVDLPFADEFTGGFGEAEAGISVFNATNTLSGFLTTGVKAKDGYSAVNLSLGVRMAW